MDALKVHLLLREACQLLDDDGDHAIAAYVGLGMSLLEDKYNIAADDSDTIADASHPAHLPKPPGIKDGHWA